MINAHEHNKNFPKGTRGILLSNLDNREVTQTVYNCNPGD